jgi:pyruvate/2-oxoacid:ferredoxin oxidoreductase beta subunit
VIADGKDIWVKVMAQGHSFQDYGNPYELIAAHGIPYVAGPNASVERPLAFQPEILMKALAAPANTPKKAD